MQLLQDLHQLSDYVGELYCDNQSTIKIVKNLIIHAQTQHVKVYYHFIREKVLQEHIVMKYIKTKDQVVVYLQKAFVV